ncbi:MAG TPA: N-acetyl-gamma-glutamyl-phosphate reductase, partial [Spirochaetia bacterium]|nr:N-acetyl-gamma-glutamyl-phosphate reductase [Spirochaetia bacterium]
MKTAVLGATGYTGGILLRLLSAHPEVTEILAVSSTQAGQTARSVDPGLSPSIEEKMAPYAGKLMTLEAAVKAASSGELDVVFSALPHLKSAEVCAPLLGKTVVIDLSADFRLKDPATFAKAYGMAMPRPDLSPRAVYGLAEWHTAQIRKADIIAVPGCYPTATLLPLLPLAQAGILRGTVIVNAISGISGAGRKEKTDLLYVERSENANAYSPGTSHRHAPEIAQELMGANKALALLFTPHMAPLRRGMAVTTVAELASSTTADQIADLYRKAYAGRAFISLAAERVPQTRDVWGSNRC